MESTTSAAITTHVAQQAAVAAAVIVTPTNEDLFGRVGKKETGAAARKRNTRKALADKTNESPTSGLLTPMMLAKEGGERTSYYRSTPYPKLHDLHKEAVVPDEQVLRTQVHALLHNKVETEEYRLHRMPSEFRTPGELAAPTPANTPVNAPSSFSHSALITDRADVLPVELQLLYKFGEAATLPPPTAEEKEAEENCFLTEAPDALDIDNLEHLEEIMCNSEKNLTFSSRESDVSTVTTISSGWAGRDDEVGKCMNEDDDDASSECSVVVNVSSPHMQEKCESPSKFSIADNRINSSPLQQCSNNSEKVKSDEEEKGYADYDYHYYYREGDEEYEDVELDGECDELCNAINQFTMNEKEDGVGLPVSTGQHIHFSYNSDDEIESKVVDTESPCEGPDSATVLASMDCLPQKESICDSLNTLPAHQFE